MRVLQAFALFSVTALSFLTMFSNVTAGEQPEARIAMTYSPETIEPGEEVKITISISYLSSGLPVKGATVPVGFEKGSKPMSTMQMMGEMVYANEVRPGEYELKFTFPEAGKYILHVHVIPPGRSMMDMMLNHADFGPLQVGSDNLQSLGPLWPNLYDPALGGGIVLLSSGLVMLGIYRVHGAKWMKKAFIILSASSIPFMILSVPIVPSGPIPVGSEASEPPHQAAVSIVKGSYDPSAIETYSPKKIKVVLGFNNTVVWSNQDISSHTITDDEGKFTSPLLNPGATWKYTFTTTGTFSYYCNPHPWMRGIVEVVRSE